MYKVITNQDDNIYVTEENEVLALNAVTTDELDDAIENLGSTFQNNLNAHINDFENPHRVTKSQIGLADVDNTSDLNKPISTATQQAINNEIERATSVEQTLQRNIDNETERATLKENEISQALQSEMNTRVQEHTEIQEQIGTINSKIPNQASSTNQLADKAFVNSSINNFAAFYITKNANGDSFESYNELITTTVYYSGGEVRIPSTNDYCFVRVDETHNNSSTRYSYQKTQWEFQYIVNETPLTAAQLAAINSGITSDLVTQITTNKNNISNLQTKIPTEYLKDASVTDNTLTIVKQDNSEITFQGGQDISNKVNITNSDTTQKIYNHIYNDINNQTIVSSAGADFDPMSEEDLPNSSYSSYFINNPMLQIIQNTYKDNEGNQTLTSISQSSGAITLQTQSQNGSSMINVGDGVTQIGDGNNFYNFENTSLNNTNNADLGTSTNKFKDLYLSGKLSDGTNEVTIGDINNKVDKVEGKGLSTEDFTTALKEKLESIDTSGGSSGGSGTVIQRNYLYNQEFTINQREKTLYPVDTADSYCVDRWQKGADVEVTYTNSTAVTTISNKSTTQLEGITQYIADDTTLLGKQVTFTVKTTEGTYSMTTEPLPLTPKTTHKNTIIQTQNTSFGALQIEFAKTHFLVRILINPATSDTDYTTITPVYAKLEQGLNFTGIDYKDKYSYSQECSQFYQKNPFRTLYTHGYYVRYSTYTQYFATCPLGTNFYTSTLKFEIKDGSHPKLLTNENGISDLVYDSVATTLKGPDKSVVAISMTINEDNSAILGDKTSKYELCMFSFPNSSIDGEITS